MTLGSWREVSVHHPLVLPVGLIVLLIWHQLQRRNRPTPPSIPIAGTVLLDETTPVTWRARLWRMPITLQWAAVLLALVALARPFERVPLPREELGIDILLCLDVSSSMEATDMDPTRNRLDITRQAAIEFVQRRQSDRVGLMRFARYSDLLCPPTLDHDALAKMIGEVGVIDRDGAEDLTGIGAAVASAAQVLARGKAPSKVVILLTDGEENVASRHAPDEVGPLRAAAICQQLGVRVHVVQAGQDSRQLTSTGGSRRIDTSQVRGLAASTGGHFFTAKDTQALMRVYRQIDGMEATPFAEPRFEARDLFVPWLVAAVGAAFLGLWLQFTVLRVAP